MSSSDPVLATMTEIEEELTVLLADEIGTFNTGQPAIWKGGKIPSTIKTTGLQAHIFPVPIGAIVPLSSSQTYMEYSWLIELINFENSPKLIRAKYKIESFYRLGKASVYQAANDLFLEQCKCYVYKPIVVNRPEI